ncbi:MAG: acylneuraminate cytidylyltransferase family protein, partial [Actinomycetota bacterium]
QNASLEIAHVHCVRDFHSISGSEIVPFKTEFPEGLDVNRPDDLLHLEKLVKNSQVFLPNVKSEPY